MVDELTDLIASRQADNSRSWTVFALMSAINGALLASLHFDEAPQEWRLVVALFAIVLCIVWHGMQRRLVSWSRWWEDQLAHKSPIWESRVGTKHPGLSSKICIWIIPLMFAAVWAVAAYHAMDEIQTDPSWPTSIGIVVVAVVCIGIGLLLWCHERSAICEAKKEEEVLAEKLSDESIKNSDKEWAVCRLKQLRRMLERSWFSYVMDLVPILLGAFLLWLLWYGTGDPQPGQGPTGL